MTANHWRTVLALFSLLGPLRAAQEHNPGHDLGSVHFPVSCTAAAQNKFDRGIALLHSFWYDEAGKTFAEVTDIDPGCAMGYWGVAMSLYHPLWAPPTSADLAKGHAAVENAKSAAAKTQRERDYIAALDAFYRDSNQRPHRERALAWRNAMERVSARYPADREAAIFFALSLLGTARASDKTYANQRRAAGILNRILPKEPDHPGVAHYMIHSYDSPQLAALALPAARSYARIAPAVPHALHMPSHIFTTLGLWEDSIQSNLASAAAARNHLANAPPGSVSPDELHAMDYLVYAYLQTCQDLSARTVLERAAAVGNVDYNVFQAAYALAAIPARYTLERRRWSVAASLEVRPSTRARTEFPYAEAITHFARGLGAARSGDPAAAHAEIDKLVAIRRALSQVEEQYDWSAQVEIQRLAVIAWTEHAEGHNASALRLMRSAAELEDKSDKHPVTPGPVLPARELLADLLMELNRPDLAFPEFDAALRRSPGRFNATYGRARAAELCGNRKYATKHFRELVELCGRAETQRLELQNARSYLDKADVGR
jgi:tetratricopeptide (TPR) repeat protein